MPALPLFPPALPEHALAEARRWRQPSGGALACQAIAAAGPEFGR